MSENKTQAIQDLDVLRPPAEYVRLGGKDIDISFIPSGVAIDRMALQDKINDLVDTPEKLAKVREGGEAAMEAANAPRTISHVLLNIIDPAFPEARPGPWAPAES